MHPPSHRSIKMWEHVAPLPQNTNMTPGQTEAGTDHCAGRFWSTSLLSVVAQLNVTQACSEEHAETFSLHSSISVSRCWCVLAQYLYIAAAWQELDMCWCGNHNIIQHELSGKGSIRRQWFLGLVFCLRQETLTPLFMSTLCKLDQNSCHYHHDIIEIQPNRSD